MSDKKGVAKAQVRRGDKSDRRPESDFKPLKGRGTIQRTSRSEESHKGLWECDRGHTYEAPIPTIAVTCGPCSRDPKATGGAAMKPKDAQQ